MQDEMVGAISSFHFGCFKSSPALFYCDAPGVNARLHLLMDFYSCV